MELSGFIDHGDFVAEGLVPTDIAALAYKGGLTFDQITAIGPRILEMKNVEPDGHQTHDSAYSLDGRRGGHHGVLVHRRAQLLRRSADAKRVYLPVEVGDILALLDTGAYQEVSMSNFSAMPRPATVLVTSEQASIVRRRET